MVVMLSYKCIIWTTEQNMKIETKENLIIEEFAVWIPWVVLSVFDSNFDISLYTQNESVATRAAKAVPAATSSVAPVLWMT